ncbi:hypothetical protein J6590_092611 [Homalodisca vitripennis]|nr:hypothetical protein J6590_092611 [Homalodisca vitripennis]
MRIAAHLKRGGPAGTVYECSKNGWRMRNIQSEERKKVPYMGLENSSKIRKVRKLEKIVQPDGYIRISNESATVVRLGKDIEVQDWKEATIRHEKKPAEWHFKFSACKRFILTRGNNNTGKVQGEISYLTDLGKLQGITKRGCRIDRIVAIRKANHVTVNPKKVADVDKLLKKHYGEDCKRLESLKFYVDLFNRETIQGPELDEGNDVEEPMDDEI